MEHLELEVDKYANTPYFQYFKKLQASSPEFLMFLNLSEVEPRDEAMADINL